MPAASMLVRPSPGLPAPPASPARALLIEPGVLRSFGLADIGRRGLAAGWAPPEQGHAWNDGYETRLNLALPAAQATRDTMLVIEGEPYVARAVAKQDIALFGNGLRLDFWRMTAREEVALRVQIDAEVWRVRNAWAMLTLSAHLPDAERPVDLGDGQDNRRLAFCFRTLCLHEAPAGDPA